MLKNFRNISLEQKLFMCFMALSMFVLIIATSATLALDYVTVKQNADVRITEVAEYIANQPEVASMLEKGYPDSKTTKNLDHLCDTFKNINVVAVYDKNGLRFYHTNRSISGETYVIDDLAKAISGADPYITVAWAPKGNLRRAYSSIINEEGDVLGFVTVSIFTVTILQQMYSMIPTVIFFAGLTIMFSAVLSRYIISVISDSLMGHTPKELLEVYRNQSSVLNSVDEGLIATDEKGIIVFANRNAEALLDIPEQTLDPGMRDAGYKQSAQARQSSSNPDSFLIGYPLNKIFTETSIDMTLKNRKSLYHRQVTYGSHRLLVSEIPLENNGIFEGILTVLNDRTDLEALSDELSGAHNMLDTLRAFNHEFLNKLHIILGYLQTGHTEDAISFITNSSIVSSNSVRGMANSIRNSKICALVMGKMMHAAELGIHLTVTSDSKVYDNDLIHKTEDYVTIIGNLLENAIEELNSSDKDIKEITLGLFFEPNCNIITCEDTGNGIPKDMLPIIFEKGVSSKGDGRGTGLYLINGIAERLGGEINIETEEGEGTCFTITFY